MAAVAFGLVYSNQPDDEKVPKTIVVKKGDVSHSIRLTGTLQPETEVEIKSRLSGILEKIFVKVGQKVQKGDPIARIRLIANPENVERANANLRTAKIQLNTEKDIYERNQELFKEGVIARSEMETSERDYLVKKEEMESAIHQLEIVTRGYKEGNRDVSDLVLATLDGSVLDLPLKEGASVTERNNYNDGSTIAVMANLDHFNFNTRVGETEVVYICPGDRFTIRLTAFNNVRLTGEWSLVYPKGEENDGIVKYPVQARIVSLPKEKQIQPGFTGSATIDLVSNTGVVLVNERYINFRHDSTFVSVYTFDNQVEERYIRTGISDGVNIAVLEGLEEGENLVLK